MKVTKGIVCRDRGMIYQRLTIERDDPADAVEVSVSTKYADDTPCNLYPLEDDYVLCLPDFKVEQKVTFTERSAQGDLVASESLLVSSGFSKWESRINYRLSRDEAFAIRNYNERFFTQQAVVVFTEVCAGKVRRVLRGFAVAPSAHPGPMEITLLDARGERVGDTNTFDNFSDGDFYEGDSNPYSSCSFFVEVPGHVMTYTVVAHFPEHPELDNFSCLEKNAYREMILKFFDDSEDASCDGEYGGWFFGHRASAGELERQKRVKFQREPKFSVIVPLYHTPLKLFTEMADSVLEQSYGNWELVLVNSTPEDAELAELVSAYAAADKRIKVVTLDTNYGITENTNRGVAEATGDYVAFFDHDDVLEPAILFEYAAAINKDPSIDVLYCDEDKLYDNGCYGGPHFKPDFSIDQLRNNNYICHMLTIRKTILDAVGPTPQGLYDGAQDHYLTLRVAEETDRIHHVPKILYHWRATAGSTALSADNKSYATDAGIRAVQSHLDRLGIPAAVTEYGRPFTYRVRYGIEGDPLVSIVVPSHNKPEVLKSCIDSILGKTDYPRYEIVIVENNSTDARLFDYYRELEASSHPVRVVEWKGEGFNFSAIVNHGVKESTGELVLLLNNDTEVIDGDWLEILAGYAQRADVGAVGPRLYFPDDTYQHAGLAITGYGVSRLFINMPEENAPSKYMTYHDMTRNVSAVTGACLMTRRSVWDELDGFDEKLSVAFNDVDFCLRAAEHGYLVVFTADTSLYHYESLTRGKDDEGEQSRIRMMRELSMLRERWADIYVKGDPYYNINLDQTEPRSCYFGLPKH